MSLGYKYDCLLDYQLAVHAGLHPHARIIIDNDSVRAVSQEWDDDGEEIGEPEYLFWGDSPRACLHLALELLGLSAEDA